MAVRTRYGVWRTTAAHNNPEHERWGADVIVRVGGVPWQWHMREEKADWSSRKVQLLDRLASDRVDDDDGDEGGGGKGEE